MSESNAFKITYGNTSATFSEGEPDIVLNTNGKHLDSNIQIEQGNATDYGIYFGDNVSDETTGKADATGDITLNTHGAVSDKKIIVKPRFQSAVDTPYLHFWSPNPFIIGDASRHVAYPNNFTLQFSYSNPEQTNAWSNIEHTTYVDERVWTQQYNAVLGEDNQYHFYMRGVNGTTASNPGGGNCGLPIRSDTKDVSVSGRLSSLINYNFDPNGNAAEPAGVYKYLFSRYGVYNSSGSLVTYNTACIKDASRLIMPSAVLSYSCSYMFAECTSLVAAPLVLPAEELEPYCYQYMFQNCTLLTTPPIILATDQAANYCCRYMFDGCSNLTILPKLYITTFATACYQYMYRGCNKIKISATQTGEYQTPYLQTGSTVTYFTSMFANTGGTFTGSPAKNTTYYTSNQVI